MDESRRKFMINASKVAYAAPVLTSITVAPTIASAGSGPEFGGNDNSNNGWHGNGNSNSGYDDDYNDTDSWDDSRRNPKHEP